MKKKIIPLLLAGTALVSGCNEEKATTATPSAPVVQKEDAVAVVNGKYISKDTLAELESEVAERAHGQVFPKEKLIEELIQRELLVQEALKKGLDKSPEVVQRLETLKKSLLSQAVLQDYLKANPVTDEEIKAEYDSKVAAEKGTEYKARHILVKTEDEAKKLIAKLDKGANFAELASKHSTDTSSEGGDLGWFTANQMVAPFSQAVETLENGKYTKTPVQTQFGWHVILREDSRPQTPPPFEAVKEQLAPYLQRQKVQSMIENLRKQAQVEVLVPTAEEQPKPEAAEPAAPAGEPATTEEQPAVEPTQEGAAPTEEGAAPEAEEPAATETK
ncbi:peptidylprolyl isomerase [Methylobacter sp. BBA5.1]|uniref:peptidylprolyl isomerase n=1 Tax=Methylobacter sp. BBA5.1 TaxID=1495064 RepID=UPI00056126A5|nr:peptidylprolyl isomerase [Methylobacter sp. BBA5.1]